MIWIGIQYPNGEFVWVAHTVQNARAFAPYPALARGLAQYAAGAGARVWCHDGQKWLAYYDAPSGAETYVVPV